MSEGTTGLHASSCCTGVVTIVTMPIVRINHVIITTETPIHHTLHAKLVKSLDYEHCTDKQDDSNSPQI